MEQRPNQYRRPLTSPLETISAGVDAIVSNAKNTDSDQRRIFYGEIGRALLDVLPPEVTTLFVTRTGYVRRSEANTKLPEVTWTLEDVEEHAKQLALENGDIYKARLGGKAKQRRLSPL